jgi:uncharacterized BrkB/YihY/UPF0761 family membrane protein
MKYINLAKYSLTIILTSPMSLLANTPGDNPILAPTTIDYKLKNPLKGVGGLTEFLELIIDTAMLIAIPIIVLAILWSGFLFIKAQGKPEEIKKARQVFYWVIIGTVIILAAKVLLTLVTDTVNSLKG